MTSGMCFVTQGSHCHRWKAFDLRWPQYQYHIFFKDFLRPQYLILWFSSSASYCAVFQGPHLTLQLFSPALTSWISNCALSNFIKHFSHVTSLCSSSIWLSNSDLGYGSLHFLHKTILRRQCTSCITKLAAAISRLLKTEIRQKS
jgi:hypothetical protein